MLLSGAPMSSPLAGEQQVTCQCTPGSCRIHTESGSSSSASCCSCLVVLWQLVCVTTYSKEIPLQLSQLDRHTFLGIGTSIDCGNIMLHSQLQLSWFFPSNSLWINGWSILHWGYFHCQVIRSDKSRIHFWRWQLSPSVRCSRIYKYS